MLYYCQQTNVNGIHYVDAAGREEDLHCKAKTIESLKRQLFDFHWKGRVACFSLSADHTV